MSILFLLISSSFFVVATIPGNYPTVYGKAEGSTISLYHWTGNDPEFSCTNTWSNMPAEYAAKRTEYELIETLEYNTNQGWFVRSKGCCLNENYCQYPAGIKGEPMWYPEKDYMTHKSLNGKEWISNSHASTCYTEGSVIAPWGNYFLYCAQTYNSDSGASDDYVWVLCDEGTEGEIAASGDVFCDGTSWRKCDAGKTPITSQIIYPDGKLTSDKTKNSNCCTEDQCVSLSTGQCTNNNPNEGEKICLNNNFIQCAPKYKGNLQFNKEIVCDGSIWQKCDSPGKTAGGYLCGDDLKWKTTEICDLDHQGDIALNNQFICYEEEWKECKSGVTETVNEYECGKNNKWINCDDAGDSCLDSVCWTNEACKEERCNASKNDLEVVWSYNLPEEQNNFEDEDIPGAVYCCAQDSCSVSKDGPCQKYDSQYNPTYLCGENNNWYVCGEKLEGQLSGSKNFYCSNNKWIPVEANCSNGIDDQGAQGVVGLKDCADPTCKGKVGGPEGQLCEQPKELTCNDGFDNDRDGILTNYPPTFEPTNDATIIDESPNAQNPEEIVTSESQYELDPEDFEQYEYEYNPIDIPDTQEQQGQYMQEIQEVMPSTGGFIPGTGQAVSQPGQETKKSWLTKLINSIFDREEAVAGQAIGEICPQDKTCSDQECESKWVVVSSMLFATKYYACQETENICNDGFDNDGNGKKDCNDVSCNGIKIGEVSAQNAQAFNQKEGPVYCEMEKEVSCNDGWNNDGKECSGGANDGNSCDSASQCPEGNCAPLTDCEDKDCWNTEFCNMKEGNCKDGIDNDEDGKTDCQDSPDCNEDITCNSDACVNDIDDDNDGFINCRDEQCLGELGKDPNENINDYHYYKELGICQYSMSGETICNDGFDNDADSLIDCSDPNCKGKTGPPHLACDKNNVWGCEIGKTGICQDYFNEGETNCEDKYDNDGDSLADCYDPDCIDQDVCKSWIAPNWWGPQTETHHAGGDDCRDHDCYSTNEVGPQGAQCCDPSAASSCETGAVCEQTEWECVEITCDDGIDNDGDNQTDCVDPSCQDKSCGESSVCSNGVCKALPGPGKAQLPDVPVVKIFTYKDILEELNKCEVIKQEGVCNTICGTKKCAFADGGRNTCSEGGSTKCTCC